MIHRPSGLTTSSLMAAAVAPEQPLSLSRPDSANALPPRVDEVLEVVPATDTAPSSASRFSLLEIFAAPFVAVVKLLGLIFREQAEATAHDLCPECERPCATVNPEIPTAEPCTGRVHIGDCTVCVETVQLTPGRGCPKSPRHLVANKKPKPYTGQRCADCETCVAYDAALYGRFNDPAMRLTRAKFLAHLADHPKPDP